MNSDRFLLTLKPAGYANVERNFLHFYKWLYNKISKHLLKEGLYVEVGDKCAGQMRIIAFITDYAAVDRIINHIKLTFAAERPPPP